MNDCERQIAMMLNMYGTLLLETVEFRDTFLLPTSTCLENFVNGILTVIVSAVVGGQQKILSGQAILRILIRPNTHTHSHTSSLNMYGLEQINEVFVSTPISSFWRSESASCLHAEVCIQTHEGHVPGS